MDVAGASEVVDDGSGETCVAGTSAGAVDMGENPKSSVQTPNTMTKWDDTSITAKLELRKSSVGEMGVGELLTVTG